MELTLARKPNKTLLYLFLLSLVAHTGMLFKNVKWSLPDLKDIDEPKPLVIKIKNFSQEKPKQIVRTNKSKNKIPTAAEYLSEETNTFDRQTTAANNGKFKRAGVGYRNGVEQANNKKNHQSKKKHKKVASLKDISLAPSMDFGELEKERREKMMAQKGLKNGDANSRGLSANNDYLENVPLGDFTQLNTQEYKYFGFYNRIRERLENFWGSSVRQKSEELFKSGRRFPASENYVTALVITIDSQGVIKDVKVKSSSGVRELDNAAIESFNKAGPFPNPPKELVKNGKAIIEWGFVVKS